jgi:hypothetical protein
VLKATKVRFPTAFPELAFDLVTNKEKHKDVLGFDREIWFNHSVARPLKAGEREQIKDDKKDQKNQEKWALICREMLDLIKRDSDKVRSHYERLPFSQGGVKASQEKKTLAIDQLLRDGLVEQIELSKAQGRATHYLRAVEALEDTENRGKYSI